MPFGAGSDCQLDNGARSRNDLRQTKETRARRFTLTDHTAAIYFAATSGAALLLCVGYELAIRRLRRRATTATDTGLKLLALLLEEKSKRHEFEWGFTAAPKFARSDAA
jgi:hypothetical protein